MKNSNKMIFDYTWARTYVGVVALLIAFLSVVLHNFSLPYNAAFELPNSISATYYTGARDYFVAQLFVVAAFLISYKGHNTQECIAAKVAAFCAMVVAWVPTNGHFECESFCTDRYITFFSIEHVHTFAAVSLMVILVYFCYRFYQGATKKLNTKLHTLSVDMRRYIYATCGITMTLTMLVGVVFFRSYPKYLFWIEAICLVSFGIAWLVAGKKVPYLSSPTSKGINL